MDSDVCLGNHGIFLVTPIQWFSTTSGGPSMFIITLDAVMLLRIFALYGYNKRGMFHMGIEVLYPNT